jgi:hypothetical protein
MQVPERFFALFERKKGKKKRRREKKEREKRRKRFINTNLNFQAFYSFYLYIPTLSLLSPSYLSPSSLAHMVLSHELVEFRYFWRMRES